MYADTAPGTLAPSARASTTTSATWLESTMPKVHPASRAMRRMASWPGCQRKRMCRSDRRSEGTSRPAWTTTPRVVPDAEQDQCGVVRAGWWRGSVSGTSAWNHTSMPMTTRLLAIGTNIGAANLPWVLSSAVNRAISP